MASKKLEPWQINQRASVVDILEQMREMAATMGIDENGQQTGNGRLNSDPETGRLSMSGPINCRMSTAERDALAAVDGDIIFNTNLRVAQIYISGTWTTFAQAGG